MYTAADRRSWSVVLLLIGQWYTSEAIPRTHNPLLPPSESDLFQHAVHNYAGLLIGALVLLRIGLRMFPPQSLLPRLTNWRDRTSQAVHWALYFSLLGQVAAGFVTSYLWAPAARFHVLFWNVTLILVGLHIAAAAYHAFRGDGVVWRMIPSTLELLIRPTLRSEERNAAHGSDASRTGQSGTSSSE
ncbi:MAG: cytochrome B [Ahrensia sp.]|nr:cytochrome B [Ahrensia sp.]